MNTGDKLPIKIISNDTKSIVNGAFKAQSPYPEPKGMQTNLLQNTQQRHLDIVLSN